MKRGYEFTEEPPLAYAGHMMVKDTEIHSLRNNKDVWASDWTGHFYQKIPRDEKWSFVDYFSGERINVAPSIVHAMRSKEVLRPEI